MTTERGRKAVVPKSVALVLSGGGARGAYEVGVLAYLYGELARRRDLCQHVDVICGTSVGAINGCFLAAHMADPASGVRRLVDLWTNLQIDRVLRFGLRQTLQLPRLFRGGSDAPVGLFDVQPMVELITQEISWRMVSRSIQRGLLRGLSVSATEIATGRTSLFLDTAPEVPMPAGLGPRMVVRRATIGPEHALASAAIPLIFPPVRIGALLYCDGGLRQNTPIAPAIRLGAERILIIGLSKEVRGAQVSETPSHGPGEGTPGALFLLGKVLNAFLLDHVQTDVELLNRINQILSDGEAVYGGDFTPKISDVALSRGEETYRPVEALVVRPSQDIGMMAGQHVRRGRLGGSLVTRQLLALLDTGVNDESDLASYLLFDGAFARKLIDLGRADAEAQRDRLLDFVLR
ncbi:MAG: patatin-like phospholipase family protein [Deltaproteobacteria bacterium]|nr:patatin-like phospholipase family protein [Deltaproteobacteria bacterium]